MVAEVEGLNKLADDLEKLNKQLQRFEESMQLQAESRANEFDRIIDVVEQMVQRSQSELLFEDQSIQPENPSQVSSPVVAAYGLDNPCDVEVKPIDSERSSQHLGVKYSPISNNLIKSELTVDASCEEVQKSDLVTFNHLSSKFSLDFVWNKFEVVGEMDGYKSACVQSRSSNFCSQGVCEKVQEISLLHFEMFGELHEGYDILHGTEELLVIWQHKPPPLPPENVLKNEGYDQESSNSENTIVDMLRVLSIHMPAHVDLITKGLIIALISYSNQHMEKMFSDQSLITGVSFTPFDEQDGGGVEIVVGMQWFEQLGAVVTNYKSLTVQISWKGLPIILIGKDIKCPDSISVQQLCKPQPAKIIVSMFQLMISGGNQCVSQDIIPSWILQVLDSFEAGFDNDIVGDKKMLTGGATARGVIKSVVLVFFEAILEGLFWWLLKASTEIICKGTFGTYNFVLEAEITMRRLPTLPAFIKEMICITESCEDGSGSLGDQSGCHGCSTLRENVLKNEMLRPLLRKFALVFTDDILIYSKSWEERLIHLDAVLTKLAEHSFVAKSSKCDIGKADVEYLGHIIQAGGMWADQSTIEVVQQWPKPTTVRPRPRLLRKDALEWFSEASGAFDQAIAEHPSEYEHFQLQDDLVVYKHKLWVPNHTTIKGFLLHEFQATHIGGQTVPPFEQVYWSDCFAGAQPVLQQAEVDVNTIFMFSVPRPPEVDVLDHEVNVEAKEVHIMSFEQAQVNNKVLHLLRKWNKSTLQCGEIANLEDKVFRRMEE